MRERTPGPQHAYAVAPSVRSEAVASTARRRRVGSQRLVNQYTKRNGVLLSVPDVRGVHDWREDTSSPAAMVSQSGELDGQERRIGRLG